MGSTTGTAVDRELRELVALRRSRSALRSELETVSHWRRLVRSRIDLTVASVVLPGRLGVEVADVLPEEARQGIPSFDHLARLVRMTDHRGRIDDLHELREYDRQLADYASVLRRYLEGVTDLLADRVSADPGLTFPVLENTQE